MKIAVSNKTDDILYVKLLNCKKEELCGEDLEADDSKEFNLDTTVANLYVWIDANKKCKLSDAEWKGAVPVGQYIQIHNTNGRLELWMDDQLLPEVTVDMCKKRENNMWRMWLASIIGIFVIMIFGLFFKK